jgi:polar amino acid transport system substrate-binding protein
MSTTIVRDRLYHVATFAIALSAITMTWSSVSRAATLDEIKKRGYMTVVTEDDFRPFEFVKDGKPTGFDNELLERLRKYAPFEIRQEIIPWPGILAGVSTGKYDVAVTAVAITKNRQPTLDFTTPLADNSNYYVKRKSDTSIKSVADLNGKSFGLQVGSVMKERLPELQAMLAQTSGKLGTMTEYSSFPDAYQDLANGRIDYVINTYINLSTLVKEKPAVFELGQAVSGRIMPAWAVKKGNASLWAFLNGFLTAERENGELAKLQEKWFDKSFDDLPLYWMTEY